MILRIKCPVCEGPMWEEDLPDSDRMIDLVCIYCGKRAFYPKVKYLKWKKRFEESVAARRGTLPAPGAYLSGSAG